MTIYQVTEEEQSTMNKRLSELFELEESNTNFKEYFVETCPWADSEAQSRPGKQNGMYGYKWGDKHPKGMKGKKHSEETKKKWRETRKGSTPWNLGIKSPEHSEYMKTKMLGNDYAKGIRYPRCSCLICKKEVSSTTINRHLLSHN